MNTDYNKISQEISRQLESFNKEQVVNYCLELLESGDLNVPELYENVLAPAMNAITVPRQEEDRLIWREHAETAIARAVIECAYPYVIKERERFNLNGTAGRVMIACPEDEYHELGARMGADFFTIARYDAVYIGCNTPMNNILSAAKELSPDNIVVCVTNFLNLVSLKKLVGELRKSVDSRIRIIVSGSAAGRSRKTAKDFGADAIVNSFADVVGLGREKP